MRTPRGWAPAAALVGAVGLALAGAAPATAHVVLESASPAGDGTTTLTFAFDHGCEGAPTTALAMTVPPGVEVLGADAPHGWDVVVDGDEARWAGVPVPDGRRTEVTLTARVEGAVGDSFAFPTRQECEGGGGYDWVGTDPSSPEPAPVFVATAAVLAPPAAVAVGTGASLAWAVAAAGALAVAAGAGGGVLARRRAPRTSPT